MNAADWNVKAAGNCCGCETPRSGFLVVGNQPHPLVAIGQNFLDVSERDIPREFDTEALAVASHRCNPHANAIDRNLRMEAHELVGLGHTFPFFACLAVGHFSIDPWNKAGREGRSKLARRQASASLCLSTHPIDFESVFRWLGACWVRDAFQLLDQLQDFRSTR